MSQTSRPLDWAVVIGVRRSQRHGVMAEEAWLFFFASLANIIFQVSSSLLVSTVPQFRSPDWF